MSLSERVEPTLKLEDAELILKELYPAVDKWHNTGIQLGLHASDLKSIESNYPSQTDRLVEMISKWLKTGQAKWSTLIEALKSCEVGESKLSEQLRRKYRPLWLTTEASKKVEAGIYMKIFCV